MGRYHCVNQMNVVQRKESHMSQTLHSIEKNISAEKLDADQVPDDVGPSLSILLPCKNEEGTMLRQIRAVVSQLRRGDQVVYLDDGSSDFTRRLMEMACRPDDVILSNAKSVGVCNAYNQCAKAATGDWILGTSGNDLVQPGVIAAWRRAAATWPEARLAFGNIEGWRPLEWRERYGFVAPHEWPAVWQRCQGFRTHGAAAFIRRDAWGDGYLPDLEWMADWYQTFVVALRWGSIHLPIVCSKVFFGGESFSAQHSDDDKYNKAMRCMNAHWLESKNDDVRVLGDAFHQMTGWLNLRDPRPAPPRHPGPTGRLPGKLVSLATGEAI